MKTPLAWLQLTHERIRLLVALAGIGFADLLMFFQLGFQAALFDSSVALHQKFRGDIFLLSTQTDSFFTVKQFSRRRLFESLGVDGVDTVHPLYLGFAAWKNPETHTVRQMMIMGYNPNDRLLDLPGLDNQNNLNNIKLEDTVLFDKLSRPEFGAIPQLFIEGKKITTEIDKRRVTVGGLFTLGASFSADGNAVTSDINFLRIFDRDPGLIDVGVINLKSGANLAAVQNKLKEKLPKDVFIFTKAEFVAHELYYWETGTAIGFIFSIGAAMGFVVGIVIVYQVLYTDVADHLPEYATLKAMGYQDSYFLVLIFQEAIILAILGFIPGFFASTGLYALAAGATNLPIAMTLNRAISVFILTLIMCSASGVIAVRKLRAADPADIF
jgi:putative ABC transport system permease protein